MGGGHHPGYNQGYMQPPPYMHQQYSGPPFNYNPGGYGPQVNQYSGPPFNLNSRGYGPLVNQYSGPPFNLNSRGYGPQVN